MGDGEEVGCRGDWGRLREPDLSSEILSSAINLLYHALWVHYVLSPSIFLLVWLIHGNSDPALGKSYTLASLLTESLQPLFEVATKDT